MFLFNLFGFLFVNLFLCPYTFKEKDCFGRYEHKKRLAVSDCQPYCL